jgi:hypothetical protein
MELVSNIRVGDAHERAKDGLGGEIPSEPSWQ